MSAKKVRLPKDERRLWDDHQVHMFVKEVFNETRDAWNWLPRRAQEALVAERAFAVVRCNYREAIPVQAMDCLLRDMLLVAGLRTEEEG